MHFRWEKMQTHHKSTGTHIPRIIGQLDRAIQITEVLKVLFPYTSTATVSRRRTQHVLTESPFWYIQGLDGLRCRHNQEAVGRAAQQPLVVRVPPKVIAKLSGPGQLQLEANCSFRGIAAPARIGHPAARCRRSPQ